MSALATCAKRQRPVFALDSLCPPRNRAPASANRTIGNLPDPFIDDRVADATARLGREEALFFYGLSGDSISGPCLDGRRQARGPGGYPRVSRAGVSSSEDSYEILGGVNCLKFIDKETAGARGHCRSF
jgi:hypothetical protein